ncbi:MAG: choice-of-anchor D domain-containing protein [Verrucomicrobiae bacterium]|nr:choice-of-anchor D domain-containing protein [Verrucomicrobiae bacterium]
MFLSSSSLQTRPPLLPALVGFLILASGVYGSAATRYVSVQTGSDSNSGTLASPWKTLQKAANVANAGDTILVRGGVYPENVIFSRSGTSGNPIVFQAYPNETPIVDGSSLDFGDLPEDSLFEVIDVNWLTIDGFEFRNLTTTNKNHTPKGIFIAGACNGITIVNCTIHDIENRSTTSNGNAHGIAAYGWSSQPIQNLRIENCELYDLILGASEALVLNGNVNGFEVIGNHVHDCNNIGIDLIGYEDTAPSASLDRARNGVCRDNVVHHINTEYNPAYGGNLTTGGGSQSAGGIYVDGGVDILIERNTIHHCNIGIELASEHNGRWTERIELRSNVIYLNDIGGIFLGGYNGSVGGTRDCVIRHNSLYQNDVNEDWNGEIFFQHHTEDNVVTHNILFANSNGLFIGNPATTNTGNVVNWNLFHAPSGADIKWQWKNTYYYDLTSYRSGTGNDANSPQTNPLFVAAGSANFHLQSGSPAIDSGDPGFTPDTDERDRDGNLRVHNGSVDRGAYEYGSQPESASIELNFSGNAQPLSNGDTMPGSADGTDFGYVAVAGGSVVRTLVIQNNGGLALDVSALNIAGSGQSDYHFGALPPSIPPGNSATVDLTFDPSAVTVSEATVEVVSNASISSFTFAIRGIGVETVNGSAGIAEIPVVPDDTPPTINVAFDPGMAGTYAGPILDRGDESLRGRFANLRLNSGGAFTAVLFHEASRSVLRGSFDGLTPFTGEVSDANGNPVTVTLTLQQSQSDPGGWKIAATLDGTGVAADATLVRATFHPRLNPCPWAGRYTLLLPPPDTPVANEPEGTGWATVLTATNGLLRANGQLGDGTSFTTSAFVSADGEWFFYQTLYRTNPRGQIGGWMKFREIPGVSDLNGELQWTKTADPRESRYPDGFERLQPVIGSLFEAPGRGERSLDELADQLYNAQVSLIESSLPGGGFDRVVNWLANDRVTYFGPERLFATVNRRTGMLRGLFWDRDQNQRLPFRGAIFQRQGIAGGCFLAPDRAGYLLIEPGTDFDYPGSETRGSAPGDEETPSSPPTGPTRTDASPSADSAGVFSGLMTDGAEVLGSIGRFRLTASGTFSAVFWFQGQRLILRGTFDENGAFDGEIPRRNDTPIAVTLQLEIATSGQPSHFVSGQISDGSVTGTIDLHQSFFSRRNPIAPEDQGRYTALLPAGDARGAGEPGGDGIALVNLAPTGRVAMLFRLGDGTPVSRATNVFANGELPLYIPLYRGSGYLGGELRLRDLADVSQFDGTLRWEKGANARDRRYPDGFALDQPTIGSRFTFRSRDQRSLDGYADSYHNAWIRFEGGSLASPGPIDQVLSWLPSDRVYFYGPERLVIRINPRTGFISGLFDDREGFRIPFRGVLYQEQDLAQGHFLETDATGRFQIDPR